MAVLCGEKTEQRKNDRTSPAVFVSFTDLLVLLGIIIPHFHIEQAPVYRLNQVF